jgi:phosphatidyl-myo-inositol dimannoside synthase
MSGEMKIHMLAPVGDAFGGRGGIAQYNRDLFGALAQSGAVGSITVLPRHAPDEHAQNRDPPPMPITQLRPCPGRLLYALAALRAARALRVDVVFCGHLYMSPLALLIARLKRAKLIVALHGIEAWGRPSSLRRRAVEAADLVLCVSRRTRARALAWAALAPERALVLPNTVGEVFAPGDGAALRASLGLNGKAVLLTVGRMDARERYKGHDRVIAALPSLIAAGHDAIYVVVGEGGDMGRLRALVQATGVAERVRFVGALDRAALVEAYRMADVFVMPSDGEGFGIAFLEAMACGTPAIGLDVAGARDALGDGALGTLVAQAELADALARRLARGKGDGSALARAVRRSFGRERFAALARLAFDRLAPA